MQRRNGTPVRNLALSVGSAPTYPGRLSCRECGAEAPRGSQRPFCLEHAPYARRLRRELRAAV